jgi:hypothetical protein
VLFLDCPRDNLLFSKKRKKIRKGLDESAGISIIGLTSDNAPGELIEGFGNVLE